MIKYIIALNNINLFNNYIKPHIKPKYHQLVDNDDGDTMFKKYNFGLANSDVSDDDIVVFVHEDVRILDENFEQKLEILFNNYPSVGIAGVIGTTSFTSMGGWWLGDRTQNGRGHIMQDRPDLSEPFHMVDRIGNFFDVVSVDGCCFAMRGS